jgi:hypothetical protein
VRSGVRARAVEGGRISRIEAFRGKYITTASGQRIYFETDLLTLRGLDREGGLRPEGLQFS